MSKVAHTPGPWAVGYRAMDVGTANDKLGGYAKLFDVRGWGYLTGHGHGGLGLPPEEAYEIQKANAALAAAAPELLDALRLLTDNIEHAFPGLRHLGPVVVARTAISKAEGRQP